MVSSNKELNNQQGVGGLQAHNNGTSVKRKQNMVIKSISSGESPSSWLF